MPSKSEPPRRKLAASPLVPTAGSATVVKSAKRVFEVLEFFAERRGPASVADVVDALGYPQSSTSVLLQSMAKLRYLEYSRHKRVFVPTMRVALLGSWVHDQVFSHTSLVGLVQKLHEASGATVILGMQNDIHVQYIHLLQHSTRRIQWYIKPGSLRPLHRTSIGRMLLSRKSDLDVVYLLRRINAEERNADNRIGESELLRELYLIRARGHAYTEGTLNEQGGVISMMLPTPASQPCMAIGIGSDIDDLRRRRAEFLQLLTTTLQPYQRSL